LGETDFLQIGVKSSCLIGSPGAIPNRVKGRIIEMAREYERTGSITFFTNRQFGKVDRTTCQGSDLKEEKTKLNRIAL
jgi:hypothetical protein